jgi:YVTN family beta-propeller protein
VGLYPLGLAYDSGTGEVFVADFTSPAVAAISDATNSVVATVEVPGLNNPGFTDSPSPQYVAYDSAKGEIFASNLYGDCVTVISDATNTVVATIGLGNNTVNSGVGLYPVQLAYDSAKGEIFVVEQGPTTTVGSYDASAGAVSIISDATNKVIATVPLGDFPSAIAYDPAKGEMFVVNDGRNQSDTSASNTAIGIVSVISDVSNSVVASVPVGPFPGGIAYDPAKEEVFVSSAGSTSTPGSVAVISDATNAVVATVPLNDAGTAAYDSARGELYVVTTKENSTTIISDSTNSVVGTKAAGPFPFYIAYDPARGELFVSNPGADTVTVLSDASASSTSTTAPSSATTSSSSAFDSSFVLIVAVNAAVFLVLGAVSFRRAGRKDGQGKKLKSL